MTSPLLDVRGLTKQFGGVKAVNGFDLSLAEGEIVGLIGPNGAGKTTVFNMLSGTLRPTSGTIHLAGREVTRWRAHRVCSAGMTRTFQVVRPFRTLSVTDNVLVGATGGGAAEAEARSIAAETLEFVGLADQARRPAGELSLIDLKRLEVARALAARPKVLLLDEVFAGLTPRELPLAVELVRAIRRRGVSLIVIEHLMQVVMNLSDRVVVLHHGEELAVGTPEEVVANPVVIEAYLGTEYRDAHGL
jgi:branched-chain amino acid transport system ATP-binding protein